MKLNDRVGSTIVVSNICTFRKQKAQMAGHGGIEFRTTGGVETLEYDDSENLDKDMYRLDTAVENVDNPIRYYTPGDTGPR